MTDKSELLKAIDETIDDAVKYADPMALRGLLYQLTGDESIAATQGYSGGQTFRAGKRFEGVSSGPVQGSRIS